MSLEKKAENLLEAVTALITVVTDLISGEKPVTYGLDRTYPATSEAAGSPTKKALAELKKKAKALAGEVLKKFDKAKLKELLALYDAKKFTDIKGEPEVFENFIAAAEATLTKEPENDDLLGDVPEDDDPKEYTLEDVKALLLKVNNTKELGRDATKQILADLGVTRLGELKKDKFKEAVEKTEAALKNAEAI